MDKLIFGKVVFEDNGEIGFNIIDDGKTVLRVLKSGENQLREWLNKKNDEMPGTEKAEPTTIGEENEVTE